MNDPYDQTHETTDPVAASPPSPQGVAAWPPIGKYHVIGRVGSGGQAEVFKAYDPLAPQRIVAIKWFVQPQALDKHQVWTREILPLMLDDPGLVRLYDVGIAENRSFLVMEYVEGVSPQVVVGQARNKFRRAAEIVADAAAIVQRLHGQGVQHRDLKPDNLILDAQGRLRVLDFGLGRLARIGSPTVPQGPGLHGTPGFMAPEQARGDADRIDCRTDVFGLGAIAYALVTGQAPYPGDNLLAKLEQAREGKILPPRRVNRGVPAALERVICKAIHPAPDRRYQSAGALERDLRRYLRWHNRRLQFALVALLLLAVLVIALWKRSPLPPLEGELGIRVWNESSDAPKGGLPIDDPRAVPVRNGEQVQLHAQLNAPAYLYLLWIGSDGRLRRLYPPEKTDGATLREIHSPEQVGPRLADYRRLRPGDHRASGNATTFGRPF